MAIAIALSFALGYILLLKWILLAMAVPVTFIAGYWFSSYRYSFIAPFVFYAFCVTAVILAFVVYNF